MHVFIDTNVFLSFYHLTNEDLEELKKLVVLIKNKSITLHLPEQVKDETWRNRASKIKDKFEGLKKEKFSLTFPAYCKGYEDYKLLKDSLKECEKHHATMVKKIESDIENQQLEADILIKDLFEKAKLIKRTNDIILKARERMDIGNPPGKNNSLGDAINWESLLSSVPKKAKICIIADDKDLYSPLNDNELNEFLIEEWRKEKSCEPQFYRKLSLFFKKHFPDISLAAEIEKDSLIEKLSASANFASTHSLISALSKYNSFSEKQAEDLMNALLLNNQINWIISDEDVHGFYKKIYDDHFFSLLDNHEVLESLLAKPAEDSSDNLPF